MSTKRTSTGLLSFLQRSPMTTIRCIKRSIHHEYVERVEFTRGETYYFTHITTVHYNYVNFNVFQRFDASYIRLKDKITPNWCTDKVKKTERKSANNALVIHYANEEYNEHEY